MTKKFASVRVFFNASVILAGLFSPAGGSGKLLSWVGQRQLKGIISEVIVDEVTRRAPKIGKKSALAKKRVETIFPTVMPAPGLTLVRKYKQMVKDHGDAHVLAAAEEANSTFLVTLDKKHLLVLQKKIMKFKIVSPKDLIEAVSRRRA